MSSDTQNKLIDKLDKWFGAVAEWSVNHRLVVMLMGLLMLGLAGYYLTTLRIDGSIDGFLDKQDPSYVAYQQYMEDFSSDEVTYIMYRVPKSEHGPFDIEAMATIARLTEDLEAEVPFVREATSLANVEFMFADGDELIVDDLLIQFPETQQQLLDIKERVMSKPLYVNYLINDTGEYAAIYLEMDLSSADPLEKIKLDPDGGNGVENLYPQVSDVKVREILARPEYASSGIEFFLTGDVPMNALYNYEYGEDTSKIVLITLALIAVISFVLFKTSLVGLLSPLAVVLLSLIMVLGFMGFMGWPAGLFITITPTLICAIGVAQSVHVLQEYQRSLARHGIKARAATEAIKKVGGPCLLAAVTTAAGFLVMNVSHIKSLAEFGVYSGVGVLFVFVLTITLLVVFLAGGKNKPVDHNIKPAEKGDLVGVNPLVKAIVQGSIRLNLNHSPIILGLFGLVFVGAAIGLTKLKVDFNFLEEFKPYVEWRQHTELADEVMGGILSVTYVVDTKTDDGIKNVQLLQAIDKFQQYVDTLPLVKKSFSVADVVKDLNRSFNQDDPALYTIPDNQELVSQYLLVYEVSGGEELQELVTMDYSRAVVELRVAMVEASRVREMMAKIDDYLAANPLPGAEVKATGIGLLWVKMADYISSTQMLSYSLMFASITLVLCLAYGSIKLGFLAMIPNLTPVVITLGAMGWLDIHLDYMKLLLATIAIGIATDDTIHLVTRFRSRFYELGNYDDALAASLKDVGPALVITSIILVGAFLAYLNTDFAVLSDFGILLGATIALALLADLLLMPALLKTIKPLGANFAIAAGEGGATGGNEKPVV